MKNRYEKGRIVAEEGWRMGRERGGEVEGGKWTEQGADNGRKIGRRKRRKRRGKKLRSGWGRKMGGEGKGYGENNGRKKG